MCIFKKYWIRSKKSLNIRGIIKNFLNFFMEFSFNVFFLREILVKKGMLVNLCILIREGYIESLIICLRIVGGIKSLG